MPKISIMRKILIILILLFAVASIHAQNDKRLKGLDKELSEILEATKAVGFAVAIVEGDKIIYSKGFGYRDLENKIPVDPNTLFAIGSCSKAFTSSILGQLRHEDKLKFDESPIKYVPELKFYNDELNNNIIISDLMCHRTGLPRHDFSWYLFPSYSSDSLMQRIEYQEPFTGLRQQWYYNNFMFLLQGVIADRVSGKSWEDNIRDRFFVPLEMNRSNVSIAELENSTNAALGYVLVDDSITRKTEYYRIAGMRAAGSINSSVNEMSNWLIAWINNGKFNGQEIIPEAYLSEAIGSHMVVRGTLPESDFPGIHMLNYGYAWFIGSYKEHYKVSHGGNIDGFSASVCFFPTDSIGIVVLANQGGSPVPGLVRNTISDRMLSVDKTDWLGYFNERKEKARKNEEEMEAEKKDNTIEKTKPSHILIEYAGTYTNPGYGAFELILENDSLFAIFKLKKFYLNHVHYDIFEPFEIKESGIDSTESRELRFNFVTNDGGDISLVKMKIEPTLDPIEFARTPKAVDIDLSVLESYVGDYELAGQDLKIYVKNESTLYLFIAGQPEYEMISTGSHTFSFKALEGFKLEFLESEDGSVNEVNVIQPNGTFKATRK